MKFYIKKMNTYRFSFATETAGFFCYIRALTKKQAIKAFRKREGEKVKIMEIVKL